MTLLRKERRHKIRDSDTCHVLSRIHTVVWFARVSCSYIARTSGDSIFSSLAAVVVYVEGSFLALLQNFGNFFVDLHEQF
jgi:hypothetical protein